MTEGDIDVGLLQQVANDNAAQQVASRIQTVRNEAQKGSGDLNPSANPKIQAGDVIYGETIDFNNSCPTTTKPCIVIQKSLQTTSSVIKEYDYSTIEVPEGFQFAYYNPPGTIEFGSVYNRAGVNTTPAIPTSPACGVAASMILSCTPLSASALATDQSTGDAFIFVRNLSNRLTLMNKPAYGSAITLAGVLAAQTNGELEETIDAHAREGTVFGGVHFEMTGEDVTECIGGADGLSEGDLDTAYATACDPRLNYRQSLEMAFAIARRLRRS